MCDKLTRIVIVGGPATGKTTLAKTLDNLHHICTDDYLNLPTSSIPVALVNDAKRYDSWVVEGCRAVHAVFAGLKPELAIWLRGPMCERTRQQESFAQEIDSMVEDMIWRFPWLDVDVKEN